jgi:hypothetical protein
MTLPTQRSGSLQLFDSTGAHVLDLTSTSPGGSGIPTSPGGSTQNNGMGKNVIRLLQNFNCAAQEAGFFVFPSPPNGLEPGLADSGLIQLPSNIGPPQGQVWKIRNITLDNCGVTDSLGFSTTITELTALLYVNGVMIAMIGMGTTFGNLNFDGMFAGITDTLDGETSIMPNDQLAIRFIAAGNDTADPFLPQIDLPDTLIAFIGSQESLS